MKTLLTLAIFLAAALGAARAATLNDAKFLDALAEIETGTRDHAVGLSHERSRYQLSRQVWATYTTIPFRNASRPEFHAVSRNIATKHLKWIKSQLAAAGHPVNERNCALVWNVGFTAYKQGRISKGSRSYAERLSNIYRLP